MKKSKFPPSRSLRSLRSLITEKQLPEISREYGVRTAAFYKWLERYSGMTGKELRRLKKLEEGNRRLKPMYATLSLVYPMAKKKL